MNEIINQLKHRDEFVDWMGSIGYAQQTRKGYTNSLESYCRKFGKVVDETTLSSEEDARRIYTFVRGVLTTNAASIGMDIDSNLRKGLFPALRAYARFAEFRFSNHSSTSSESFDGVIEYEDIFELYLKERGIVSIVQYVSSLVRASRLLRTPISPNLLPTTSAVSDVLRLLRKGQYANEKFGPIETALTRYAEMVKSNFKGKFRPVLFRYAIDLPTEELPQRLLSQISRVVRDTALAREVKEAHEHVCQVCGGRLELGPGRFYSEGHHLKPLGKAHNGLDRKDNILCVCPNCHVKLDYCAMKVDAKTLRTVPGHTVRKDFLDYHNDRCC